MPVPTPVPAGPQGQDALFSPMVYHIDRHANPDTVQKPGTADGIRRMEEILVYVARFLDNNHVALWPGVVGGNLAARINPHNDR